MITEFSAYKEMILVASGGNTHQKSGPHQNIASGGIESAVARVTDDKSVDAVSVDLSASHDVLSSVDDFFNLGLSGRFDAFHKLSPEDKELFVKIVAELAKSGYIGYEELIVKKKVERHEITSQIGDDHLRNARLYDKSKYQHR